MLGIRDARCVYRIHSGYLITRGMLDIEGVRRFIEKDLVLGLLCMSFVPFAVWRGTVISAAGTNRDK